MPSLVNCRKLLASVTKNFDRKSGTLKVFGLKNAETGDIEYVLLDGTHRYICYKYLQKKSVPADVLKDSMEEWEWFYLAGGGNVISSTHVPMDIYSKIKLIGEIMEKKVNGKVLTANEAKPIIQKNVPGFQDKCSKESINSYTRIYRSYKGKYLNMVQQVVMKKETKSHSMVKDNLELPSLMSLNDSPFKEELFRKMGESKMNKDEIITLINRNKIVKFVEDRLEDTEEEALKKNIIKAIECGKYDTWLVREDASIRDGQIEGTKLWGKIEKLLNQQNPTNSKGEEEENEHQGDEDEQLLVNNNNKRKRQSDQWESRLAKKRKTEQIHVQQSRDKSLDTERDVGSLYSTPETHLFNRRVAAIQGPARFRPPRSFKLSISTDEEYQFTTVDGELYISLTCIPHDKYKQLEDAFRSKNPNNSVAPPVSQNSIIKDTINTNNNSISLFEADEGEVLLLHSSTNNDGDFLRHDTDTSEHHYGTSETPNNNNNSRKSFSSVQSVGSYLFEDNSNGRKHARDQQELEDELQESIDSSHSSENKARKEKEKEKKKEKEKSKKKRSGKKEKNKKDKKDTNRSSERKSKKPVSERKEAQSNDVEQPTNSNDKEDRQEEDDDEKEKEHRSSKFNSEGNAAESEKKMEIDSYDEHHFDNDDDAYDAQSHQQANSSKKEEDKEEVKINDQGSEDNDGDDDDDEQFGDNDEDADNNTNNGDNTSEADHSTLEKHVKRYYSKISRIFNGKDTTTRLKQWKSEIREFTTRSGGYSVPDLKVILALLKEWSKHFNRVKPKFEEEAELNQFVLDVLWYELAHRLLSDKHGVSLKEAKAMLEKSSELVIN